MTRKVLLATLLAGAALFLLAVRLWDAFFHFAFGGGPNPLVVDPSQGHPVYLALDFAAATLISDYETESKASAVQAAMKNGRMFLLRRGDEARADMPESSRQSPSAGEQVSSDLLPGLVHVTMTSGSSSGKSGWVSRADLKLKWAMP